MLIKIFLIFILFFPMIFSPGSHVVINVSNSCGPVESAPVRLIWYQDDEEVYRVEGSTNTDGNFEAKGPNADLIVFEDAKFRLEVNEVGASEYELKVFYSVPTCP